MATSKMGAPVMKPGMSTAKAGMKRATPMQRPAMPGAAAPMGAPAPMGGMGMKKGGTASARADGIASKGKTKGTMIAMCGGGMSKKK